MIYYDSSQPYLACMPSAGRDERSWGKGYPPYHRSQTDARSTGNLATPLDPQSPFDLEYKELLEIVIVMNP